VRKSFSAKDRLRIFAAHNGVCGLSGVKIGVGDAWHIEHRVPVALGGSNEDENLYPALVEPHKAKTKDDVKRIAKAKRQSGIEGGQAARRAKRGFGLIQSRGFDRNGPKKSIPSRPWPSRGKPE
jgi:5-methylcytosine-specific restriction enzyme A